MAKLNLPNPNTSGGNIDPFNKSVKVASVPYIALALIGLPIIIFGWVVVLKFIKFMNSPVINGQVPVWAIAAAVFVVYFLFYRNRQ